jgi:hypothetical protein
LLGGGSASACRRRTGSGSVGLCSQTLLSMQPLLLPPSHPRDLPCLRSMGVETSLEDPF